MYSEIQLKDFALFVLTTVANLSNSTAKIEVNGCFEFWEQENKQPKNKAVKVELSKLFEIPVNYKKFKE
jgi:hypothetical protein